MNPLAERLQHEADLCANEGASDIAALLWEAAAAISMSPPGVGTWPIARLEVNDAGEIKASFYTPGLPAGSYDVWLPDPERATTLPRDGELPSQEC